MSIQKIYFITFGNEKYYNSLNQSKIVPLDESKKEITEYALSKIFLKTNKTEDKYASNKINKQIEQAERQKQIVESKKSWYSKFQ